LKQGITIRVSSIWYPISNRHAREGWHPGFFLDSRPKYAGMTLWGNGHLILWSCA
jgi:hypothetical protein